MIRKGSKCESSWGLGPAHRSLVPIVLLFSKVANRFHGRMEKMWEPNHWNEIVGPPLPLSLDKRALLIAALCHMGRERRHRHVRVGQCWGWAPPLCQPLASPPPVILPGRFLQWQGTEPATGSSAVLRVNKTLQANWKRSDWRCHRRNPRRGQEGRPCRSWFCGPGMQPTLKGRQGNRWLSPCAQSRPAGLDSRLGNSSDPGSLLHVFASIRSNHPLQPHLTFTKASYWLHLLPICFPFLLWCLLFSSEMS